MTMAKNDTLKTILDFILQAQRQQMHNSPSANGYSASRSPYSGRYYHFTASRISGGGNAVFPDELIINDEYVIFRKGKVIGHEEIKIRHQAVGSVYLDKKLLFADIIIETNGGRRIRANGFTRSDADKIVRLIG